MVLTIVQPASGLFYVSIWDNYGSVYRKQAQQYRPGQVFGGGQPRPFVPVPNALAVPTLRRGPINDFTEAVGYGGVIAIDPHTGNREWDLHDDRRNRQRDSDHRLECVVLRGARGLLPGARRQERPITVEEI